MADDARPGILLAALSGLLSGYRTIADINRRHDMEGEAAQAEIAIGGIRSALAIAGYNPDEIEALAGNLARERAERMSAEERAA